MEAILKFFEQYWGYSLVGGVTVGTLITFIVIQVKGILKAKADKIIQSAKDEEASKRYDNMLTSVDNLLAVTTAKLEEANKKYAEVSNKNRQEMVYNNKVTAVTFKVLSYLVMSSKLSTEDKLELYNSMAILTNSTPEEVEQKVELAALQTSEAVEEAKQIATEAVSDTKETVTETIESTKSLLDKYKS